MATVRCRRCGDRLPVAGRGRIPVYCSTRCRVAAHRAKPSLPAELTSLPRWVRHSAAKVPLTVDGRPASSTDPATWSTHAAASRSRVGAGMGFVLNGDGIVCLDLDHCLHDGVIAAWARPIIDRCPPTYIEISPSGDGLHLWGRGRLGKGRRLRVGAGTAEIYATGRYITVTGHRYRSSPNDLADLGEVISELTV